MPIIQVPSPSFYRLIKSLCNFNLGTYILQRKGLTEKFNDYLDVVMITNGNKHRKRERSRRWVLGYSHDGSEARALNWKDRPRVLGDEGKESVKGSLLIQNPYDCRILITYVNLILIFRIIIFHNAIDSMVCSLYHHWYSNGILSSFGGSIYLSIFNDLTLYVHT